MPVYAFATAPVANTNGGVGEAVRVLCPTSVLRASWPGLFSHEETAILSQAYLAAARHLTGRMELRSRPACDAAHRRLVSALIASGRAGVWSLSQLTASALQAVEALKPPTIVFPLD